MERKLIKVLYMPSLAMELLYLFTSISMYVLCHGNRFKWAFEFDEWASDLPGPCCSSCARHHKNRSSGQ